MKYLSVSFACEGPTDPRYLSGIVQRSVEDVLAASARETVEVGAVRPVLLDGDRLGNEPARVIKHFESGEDFADVLVVHSDGSGDAARMRKSIIAPIRDGMAQAGLDIAVVGLVPRRETEAWMLADSGAIARVLGVDASAVVVSQSARNVHKIADPKAELSAILRDLDGAGTRRAVRRRGSRLGVLYGALATETSLDELRKVQAYVEFMEELRATLQGKGYV